MLVDWRTEEGMIPKGTQLVFPPVLESFHFLFSSDKVL